MLSAKRSGEIMERGLNVVQSPLRGAAKIGMYVDVLTWFFFWACVFGTERWKAVDVCIQRAAAFWRSFFRARASWGNRYGSG